MDTGVHVHDTAMDTENLKKKENGVRSWPWTWNIKETPARSPPKIQSRIFWSSNFIRSEPEPETLENGNRNFRPRSTYISHQFDMIGSKSHT